MLAAVLTLIQDRNEFPSAQPQCWDQDPNGPLAPASRNRRRCKRPKTGRADRIRDDGFFLGFGAPSTTRTCDLLVRSGKKGVNPGQRETAAPMFSLVRRSPETTRDCL